MIGRYFTEKAEPQIVHHLRHSDTTQCFHGTPHTGSIPPMLSSVCVHVLSFCSIRTGNVSELPVTVTVMLRFLCQTHKFSMAERCPSHSKQEMLDSHICNSQAFQIPHQEWAVQSTELTTDIHLNNPFLLLMKRAQIKPGFPVCQLRKTRGLTC